MTLLHAAPPLAGHMKVVVTGAGGLIGRALVPRLRCLGYDVLRLVRRAPEGPDEARWDPEEGEIDRAALEGCDAAIHLAGEGVADGRWSAAKKRAILESRRRGTELLSRALAELDAPPAVLVAASAIGYYGDRGDAWLDEGAHVGQGFLPAVCDAWEASDLDARAAGIRVVRPRIGVVLTPEGGALARMLLPFRLGLGGPIGDGRHWVSWITLDDQVRVLERALHDERLDGPVNSATAHPVRFVDFARALGRTLRRPAIAPLPRFAARLAFGEMADEVLLASTRVAPRKLEEVGFQFERPELEPALRHLLSRS